ncbi:cytochrome D1 domain-containing protein [Candidatus Villigracilis vicinus]|uniref:cytochrome D1 domain-containing protein n=1 Tax=Candidatus Villigracilis vicinus TaxID=3140679 RepID=UPI0031F0538C
MKANSAISTDKYAIVGCYWPSHFTILDGQTLEPMKITSVRGYTAGTNTYVGDPRGCHPRL